MEIDAIHSQKINLPPALKLHPVLLKNQIQVNRTSVAGYSSVVTRRLFTSEGH